jgi:predicted RNA-binding Zn ribbon-like protein
MERYPNLAPAPFDRSGGHAVLDFVNTLDDRFKAGGPRERLSAYADLLRFTEETGLLDRAQARALSKSMSPAAARALRSALELREALAAVLYGRLEGRAPSPEELRRLERHFHAAGRHRRLHCKSGVSGAGGAAALEWQWGRAAGRAALPVWMLAHAAAELLLSPALARVRACEADNCRWLFLDTSKSHTRRWCDMKVCGNRMKARRFHERHA